MSVTLANLITRIGQRTGDTTNPTSTNQKRAIDLNAIFDDLAMEANFDFAKKTKRFVHIYDAPYNGRGIVDILGVSDFKEPYDVRVEEDHTVEFDFVTSDYLEVLSGKGKTMPYCYAIETFSGKDILRVNYARNETNSVIDTCDTVSENGANWTEGGGVSGSATDTIIKKTGSGSVSFDLSAAGSGYLEKTHTTDKDLRDFIAESSFRLFVYLPTGSAFTNIEIRFGSDSSNYYAISATTQYDGVAFVNGWNRVDFPWTESTTATGTPDLENVDYYRITFTHSAVAQTDVRIDDFRLIKGTPMNFVYFTDFFVKTSANVPQARFSTDTVTTTEQLLGPDHMADCLVSGAVWQHMIYKTGFNSSETVGAQREYLRQRDSIIKRIGRQRKKPQITMKPKSYFF